MSHQDDARLTEIHEAIEQGADAAVLAERYPELASEIIDLAIWFKVTGSARPSAEEERAVDEANVCADEMHARTVMLRAVRDARARMAAPAFPGIVARCHQMGVDLPSVVARLRMCLTLLTKLDRRLIDPVSVPWRLIEGLASVLDVNPAAVRRYLTLTPTLSPAASFRAPAAPTLALQETRGAYTAGQEPRANATGARTPGPAAGVQQDFRAAVASAPDLSEADREMWLSEGASDTPAS